MRTDSSLLYLPVIFRTLISCDFGIFPVVKDWDLGYSSLLNFRVGKDDEKIIITFDFWSFKSLEEKADFLRVICTFSWAFDCTLINFVVVFGNRFFCNQEKWRFFGDFIPVSAIFVTEILKASRGFAPASWPGRAKDQQLQSLQQI